MVQQPIQLPSNFQNVSKSATDLGPAIEVSAPSRNQHYIAIVDEDTPAGGLDGNPSFPTITVGISTFYSPAVQQVAFSIELKNI
jgi:hypothetical protein